jgi:uncharacterized protein (DUF3820 family)
MTTQETARMPFGKYKDKPINEIDPHYLEWVLANCQHISPDLKRAICTQLGLEFKDDPKDKEIAELQASNQDLRHKMLVSRLEAYDQGYQDGKNEHIVNKVKEWHRSLAEEYQGSTEALTAVNDAYDRLRKALNFKDDESDDSDQEWITLEDYCVERKVVLDHSQLIKEGLAIARRLRTDGSPPPHKLRHDRYGFVNGYRRCTLDEWYEEYLARKEADITTHRSATATTRRLSRSRTPRPGRSEGQFHMSPR